MIFGQRNLNGARRVASIPGAGSYLEPAWILMRRVPRIQTRKALEIFKKIELTATGIRPHNYAVDCNIL